MCSYTKKSEIRIKITLRQYAAFQSGVHAMMYMCVPAGPVHTSLLVTDWYMVSATLLTWTGAHR